MPGARSQPGSVSCSALDIDCDTGPVSCESSSSRRAGPGPGSRVLFSLSGPDSKIDLDCETGRGGARAQSIWVHSQVVISLVSSPSDPIVCEDIVVTRVMIDS